MICLGPIEEKSMDGTFRADSVYAPISVVIPTCNRANLLAECLRACARNSGGVELEFVVVDDGSADDTQAVLERLGKEIPSLVWTNIPNGGPGQARNVGATMAKHNTILFIGDDIQPLNDDFFRVHSRLHGTYESARFAVLGKCVWPTRPGFNVNFVMSHIQGHGGEQFGFADLAPYTWLDWRFFYTSNLSIKKAIVADWLINGFSPAFSLPAFEDGEFAYRRTIEPQGFRIFYDPGSIGEHYHSYSVESFIKRQVAAGQMAEVAIAAHPELMEILGLSGLADAIDTPRIGNNEAHFSDYLAVVEGLKAWGRLLDDEKILGKEAWHDDLLFTIFEISFFQGFLQNYVEPTSNFSAGYSFILSKAFQRLHRVIHHEITAHEYFKKDLLAVIPNLPATA